jgi:drug/metabolite transporter (DMT)-like permease
LFMVPALPFFKLDIELAQLIKPVYFLNLLYLGLGASALCFVTWNMAAKLLGAVKCSIYIYIVPVITVVTSFIILHEKITLVAGFGIILTLIGLIFSESRVKIVNGHIKFYRELV